MKGYAIFQVRKAEGCATIHGDAEGMEKPWFIAFGRSLQGLVTGQLQFEIWKSGPGRKHSDFFHNLDQALIVKKPLLDLLTAEPIPHEVYPVTVLDKKGQPFSGPFFLFQDLSPVDCVDLEASKFQWSSGEEGERFHTIFNLVLDEARVPKDRSLFRIREYPKCRVIRKDLGEKLLEQKVTGFALYDLGAPVMI